MFGLLVGLTGVTSAADLSGSFVVLDVTAIAYTHPRSTRIQIKSCQYL